MSVMTEDRPTQTQQGAGTPNIAAGESPQTSAAPAPASAPKEQPKMSIRLVDALGMEINVEVKSVPNSYEVRKYMNGKGFNNPTAIPAGGYNRPYDEAKVFDWSLIGAEMGELEGDKGVWCGNVFYKHREYEEETKGKKMKAKIKYSRGARQTDLPHTIEKGTGDISYVTLISFSGRGRVNPNFLKKS